MNKAKKNRLEKKTPSHIRKQIRKIFYYAFIVFVCIFILNTVQLFFILNSIQNLPSLPKPYEMIRFVIYSYGDNSLSARFWFYDLQGNELASLERAWPGTYLELRFAYLHYNHKDFVYPILIQNIQENKKKQSSGTDLRSLVQMQNNSKLLLIEDKITKPQKAIKSIEHFILNKNIFYNLFYLFRSYLIDEKSIKIENLVRGREYSVYYEDGEILIR